MSQTSFNCTSDGCKPKQWQQKGSYDILSRHPAVCYTSVVSPALSGNTTLFSPIIFLSCEGKFCGYLIMCDNVSSFERFYNKVLIFSESFCIIIEDNKTLMINIQLFQLRKGCWVPLSRQGWAIICRRSGSKLKTVVVLGAWRKRDGSFLITCVIIMTL